MSTGTTDKRAYMSKYLDIVDMENGATGTYIGIKILYHELIHR